MEQKRERLFIARLHVQHQLDVGPGHSRHTVSNPCNLRKLQLAGVLEGENATKLNVEQTLHYQQTSHAIEKCMDRQPHQHACPRAVMTHLLNVRFLAKMKVRGQRVLEQMH